MNRKIDWSDFVDSSAEMLYLKLTELLSLSFGEIVDEELIPKTIIRNGKMYMLVDWRCSANEAQYKLID